MAFGTGPTAKASGINTLAGLLYNEPLISHDAHGRPQPSLAESWTWDQNGRRLRLQLKRGVTFHDGSPLTAPVVLRFLAPSSMVPAADRPLGFQRITVIEAPDDHSLLINLSRPDTFLLTELNELRIVHPDDPDLGTGPYRLVSRQPMVDAERFRTYHGGMPGAPGVQILPFDSQRSAWAALMRGEVDAAQEITRDAVDFMERSTEIVTYASTQPFYIPFVFNHAHPAFRKREVRQAFELALNKAQIVERAMQGRGVVAHAPIWPDHWAYTAPQTPDSFAPAKAIELLEAAGYAPLAEPGSGGRLTFRCLFWSEDPQYERIALMVQRQLSDIGVEVELEPVTLLELSERARSGDFDAFIARANAGRSMLFTYLFWHSRGATDVFWNTGYTGADGPLDRLRDSATDDEVRSAIQSLSERFRRDVPAVFIAWTDVTRAVSSDVLVNTDSPDPFMSLWRWQHAPGRSMP